MSVRRSQAGRGGALAALRNHNYRLYFCGQLASVAGTFMQATAQSWLVLHISGSGTALGLVSACQYLPILLGGGPAGVLADRFDRRVLLAVTQALAAVQALGLALLVVTGAAELWVIYVLAVAFGIVAAVEQPARQALVYDLVGPEGLEQAVGLTMSLQNAGRFIGPALAGVLISTVGVGACFAVNAVSYLCVLAGLVAMRTSELRVAARPARGRGLFLEGLREVGRDPRLSTMLLTSCLLFGFAWEFEIIIPLLAVDAFHGQASTFGLLISAQGGGAVVGGLLAARRAGRHDPALFRQAILFGLALAAAAAAPGLWPLAIALTACGLLGIMLVSAMSARLQTLAPPAIRGRVLALWTVAAVGTRPLFAPLIGFIAERFGARYALALGSAAVLLLVVPAWTLARRRIRRSEEASAVDTTAAVAEIVR